MTRVELNRAQRALWLAQQMLGDEVPFAIAHCLEMRGRLDADALAGAVDATAAELDVSTVRVRGDDSVPHLLVDRTSTPSVTERVSVRTAADPEAAAEKWMAEACAAPLPLDGPLLRCALIEIGPRRWTFFARAHHILLDGYAAGLLIRHAAHRYRCAVAGPGDRSAAGERIPPTQRIEAILDHERRYAGSARRDRDRRHWQTVLDGVDRPLRLAEHPTRPSVRTRLVGADLDEQAVAGLRAAAARAGVPTVAVLVAAAAMSLGRLRDRGAVPFTLVTSARTTAALRGAAGTMSNLLPLVIDHEGAPTVDDHLRRVAASLSDALRHQQFRYEDMLAEVGVDEGDRSAEVLRRVGPVINLVPSTPPVDIASTGVDADLRVLSTGPVADLNIDVYPGGVDTLRVEVEVNADALDPGTARTVLEGIVGGVRALSEAPGSAPVGRLSPFPTPEAIAGAPAPPATLADAFLAHRDSASTAVVAADGTRHTYREVTERASRLADVLTARAAPGDVVAVLCPRSVDSVTASWAVAAAGMCLFPVDPALPEERRRALLDDAHPAVIVGDEDLQAVAADTRAPRSTLRPRHPASPDEPAYLLYTSGSTGRPKGVLVSASGVGPLLAEIRDSYELAPTSVVAHLASPGFDTAIVETAAAADAGAALAVVPTGLGGGTGLAAFLTARGVTHLFVTPAVLATLPRDAMPALTHLVVGGDLCPAPLIRAWARSGRTVRCAYGPTETTCSVTLTAPVRPDHAGDRIPLGAPMRGVRIDVLDRRLRPVPRGGDGELYVTGPSLALGVAGEPGFTSSRFVAARSGDGRRMYRTGDRVRRGADDALWFLGRADAQVEVRGVRVEPAETDRVILESGLAVQSATVAVVADGGGARLHTYVVARDPGDDRPLLGRRIRERIAAALGSAQVPASVTVLDALPLTVNNKLDRRSLPAPAVVSRAAHRAPSDETERLIVRAYGSALGTADVGVDDDFFDLAGDSLTATGVVGAIAAQTGIRVGVRDVFEAGTPARLAVRVRDEIRWNGGDRRDVARRPAAEAATPLSPAQRNVFALRNGPDHLVSFTVRVPVRVEQTQVVGLLDGLVRRHEMLRSRFRDDGTFVVDAEPDDRAWSVTGLDRAGTTAMAEFLHRPMDLAARYPLRAALSVDGAGTRIGVCLHHLAVDGVSLRVLAADLLADPSRRTAPEVGYREYARRATDLAARHRAEEIAYFARTAASAPRLDLVEPALRARFWTGAAGGVSVPFAPEAWARVRATAAGHRVTPLTVVRTAVAEAIAARTAVDRVVVGGLVSGRDDTRWADVVGMFVNTVAVTCPVGPDGGIDAVRRAERDAFAHAATAFADVADALGPIAPDRHPLFQVMLTLDEDFAVAGGPRIEPLPVDVARCDLHVSVVPPVAGRVGRLEIRYAAGLFAPDEMRAFAEELVARAGSAGQRGSDRW